jgi:hypothetical protein
VPPELEIRVHSLFERGQAKLLEPADLVLRERLVHEVGERHVAPDGQCLTQQCRACRRIGRLARLFDQSDETLEVDASRVQPKQIARRLRLDGAGAEQLPQLRDEILQRRGGGAWRVLAPECVDQPIGRDDPASLEQEEHEERALLLTPELEWTSVVQRLERAENPKLEPFLRSGAADRRLCRRSELDLAPGHVAHDSRRTKRRKTLGEALHHELEEMLGLVETLQAMRAEIAERQTLELVLVDEHTRDCRQEDLAAMPG